MSGRKMCLICLKYTACPTFLLQNAFLAFQCETLNYHLFLFILFRCFINNQMVKMVTTTGLFPFVFLFNMLMFAVTVKRVFSVGQKKKVNLSKKSLNYFISKSSMSACPLETPDQLVLPTLFLIFQFKMDLPGTSSRWDMAGTPRRHPVRFPYHHNWLLSMWRSSSFTLSPSQMAKLLTLCLRERPATLRKNLESSFLPFESVISFSHYPELMTVGEGKDVVRPVN